MAASYFHLIQRKAAKGVKVKLDTRRNATSVIVIQQGDAGAAIFETAGRATATRWPPI
jgi:hypothetical protein